MSVTFNAETLPLLLTPREAARVAGLGHNTIREWAKVGKLACVMVGSHCKVKSSSLLALIDDSLPDYRTAPKSAPGKPSAKPRPHR